ncbi:MAG TPA: MauE/DoxX family redox-associated membrane protein [Ktedonobacterales bacterium]
MEQIAAIQPLVIGALFAWAGIWKVLSPQARGLVVQSALGKLLPIPWVARAAHLAVGIGEIIVAGALLAVPPARWWAVRAASVFAVGFFVYLGVAWRVAPERPCACMGGRTSRISRKSLARAATVLMMTLLGWLSTEYWGNAIVAAPLVILVVGAEVGVLWLLSPEFGDVGPRLGKQLALRLSRSSGRPLDPECSRVPLDWDTLERHLRGTALFRQLVPQTGNRSDAWSEGCWRFMTFGADFQGRVATAVFAVPALFDPHAVSASLVDDADGTVLERIASLRGDAPPATPASAL